MRIAFDGRCTENDVVGVGKYFLNLVSRISGDVKCFIFYSKKPKNIIPHTTCVILQTRSNFFFEQILLPLNILKYNIDIFHATNGLGIPIFCPVKTVVTVHDLIPVEINNYFHTSRFPVLSRFLYILRLKISLTKASKVVSVSEYVRNRLTKRMNVKKNKIKTIYSGPSAIDPTGKLPVGLVNKKYILNNGGIDERKNLEKLIESFRLVRKQNKDLYLVITGENKLLRSRLQKFVLDLHLEEYVIFTGYVDEKILGALIKNASLVCYPSLSEGFGFPILEAFCLGVPVVSSQTSSIPEIAEKAAILINPRSTIQISNAIIRVLEDKRLAKRMVLMGKIRYTDFSWENAINEYLSLYNSIK